MLFFQNFGSFFFVVDLFQKYSALTGLIGVIIGVLLSLVVNLIRDRYRFDNEKKGAIIIIYSEIEVNLNSLKKFKDNHLIDFTHNQKFISFQQIKEFYMHLEKFPNFSHDGWDNLLRFVPSIYSDDQINKIIEFNKTLDDLQVYSKALSNHQMPIGNNDSDFMFVDLDMDEWGDIIEDHVFFESQLVLAIKKGESILEFLKN